jgi:hypothetical protein
MALSAINIVLNAVTDLFNKNVKQAADTMEKSSAQMQASANKAGQAIEQSLGSGQLRQKIAAVTAEIDEQKQITREFVLELEKLRQKRDMMSKMDVQGQKQVRKEIEQTKAAIKDQSIAVSELTAKKQGFTQQLSSTNQTLSGSRAALNGLATSFSSVSSVLAIVNDDNKQLRNVLMATNAALNFGAAVMQVKDLQAQFGSLSAVVTKIGAFMAANPFLIGAAVIAAVIALTAAWLDDTDAIEKAYEAQKKYADELEAYNNRAVAYVLKRIEYEKNLAIKRAQLAGQTEAQIAQVELAYSKKRIDAMKKFQSELSDDSKLRVDLILQIEDAEREYNLQVLDMKIAEKNARQENAKEAKKEADAIKKSGKEVIKAETDLINWLEKKRFDTGEKAKKRAAEQAKQLTGANLIAGTAIPPILIPIKIDPKYISQIVQDFDKLIQNMSQAVEQLSEEIAISLGETLGMALAGQGNGIEGFIQSVVGSLGSFIKTVGKMLIAYGISVEKFKAAFLNPAAAVVAGVAMVALGTAVSSQIKKGPGVPAFADGGIVSGPTLGLMGEYPGARSNPEVIAPLDKLKTLMKPDQTSGFVASTTIQGRDLAIVLDRYNKDTKRG